MPIVSDTGPILSFARAGHMSLLRQVVGELIIPDAVYEEIVVHGAGRAGANEVQEGSWVKRQSVQNRVAINRLPEKLGVGEREALVLAQEIGATVLIDELEARKEASRLGIPCFGSLRVLREAKLRGIISEAKPLLDDLIAAGMYVNDALYENFLKNVGE